MAFNLWISARVLRIVAIRALRGARAVVKPLKLRIKQTRREPLIPMDYKAAREIMVDSQIRPDEVSDHATVMAFLRIPREVFVPGARKSVAYSEMEIETFKIEADKDAGQPEVLRALWTPRDTAKLIKAANLKPTDIVLIIGAGTGYEAAIASQLCETVIALDDQASLVADMTDRFAELGLDSVVAVEGALAAGLADQAPFDAIIVCGMVQTVPEAWKAQLTDGGRLAVVEEVDRGLGRARLYTRGGDVVSAREVFDACPPKFAEFDAAQTFTF